MYRYVNFGKFCFFQGRADRETAVLPENDGKERNKERTEKENSDVTLGIFSVEKMPVFRCEVVERCRV